ncbi:MAG TPA: AAA family ATPase [Microvirga sp.]
MADHDDNDTDTDAAVSFEETFGEGIPADPTGLPVAPATLTLARYALQAAVTPAQMRKLGGKTPLAVLVTVPGPAWVEPIRQAAQALWTFSHIVARDGGDRLSHKPDKGNDRVASVLADGGRVLGVSHAPEALMPSSLVATADLRIDVTQPGPELLRLVIRRATGTIPSRLPEAAAAGLDFNDITAAIRMRTTAGSCVRRLQAASLARLAGDGMVVDAPALGELSGYGAAMSWCERLVDDIDAWRRHEIGDFRTLDRACVWASAPGLGKTTLARSLARTARIPMVSTSVASWFASSPGYLDSVVKAIDEVFARVVAIGQGGPSLLFLDEADGLPDRRELSGRGRDWWSPVVGRCLTTIEHALSAPSSRLVIVAATNYAHRLDEALVRPGRLGQVLTISHPTPEELAGIFRTHLRGDLAGEDLRPVARLAAGATGAQAAAWVRDARMVAARRGTPVTLADLCAVVAPPADRPFEDAWRTAVHETGHALVATLLGVVEVESVSVMGDAGSYGHTVTGALGRSPTRVDLEATVMLALGGRAAEELILGTVTAGSRSDLAAATGIVASIHVEFGLGTSLVHRGGDPAAALAYDAELRELVDAEMRRLYRQTHALLAEHLDLLHVVARALVADQVLAGSDVKRLVTAHHRHRRARRPDTTEGGHDR